MVVVSPTPKALQGTRLYQRFVEVATTEDGLVDRLAAFVGVVEPMLDLIIGGPFRDYTLHNPGHARKLVHLSGYLLEESTIDNMTAVDLVVHIMACYLHDLGMSVTAEKRAGIITSTEYDDELRQWPQLWNDLSTTRARHGVSTDPVEKLDLELRLFQLQEVGLAAFLRKRHAHGERYRELVEQIKEASGRVDLFSLRGVSFEKELITICESHNLDVAVLLETADTYTDRFPRSQPIGGNTLNVQFCAGLLRLADILDFDRERTPHVLFESLGIAERDLPGSGVTLREWNKHMAVQSLGIDDDELVVYADSTHPAIERSIREFCQIIEREIRDTASVLRKNTATIAETYRLRVPLTARAQVRPIGYVYKDLSFTLDETTISNVIMGEGLYPVREVALRELTQNAIDACRVRVMVEGSDGFGPQITVRGEVDGSGRMWIVVTDNGIGMDDAILFDYFFRVGRSYYRSTEFEQMRSASASAFAPISRFGIGVLSVFMIADRLEVRTANRYSARGDTRSRTVTVDSRFGLAFVTEQESGRQGCEVRIRLKAMTRWEMGSFLTSAAVYLRETVRRPAVPIEVQLGGHSFVATGNAFTEIRQNACEELASLGIELVMLDVARWSERLSGRVIMFLFQDDEAKLGTSPVIGSKPKVDDFRAYMTNFRGNRLTVNGVVMHVKKMNQVFRAGNRQLVGVFDVEVAGDADVEYDVTRQRLTGVTADIVRKDLRRAIGTGLRDLGVAQRMRQDYLVELPVNRGSVRPVSDEKLLVEVAKTMPEGPWPVGLHHDIAVELDIPSSVAYRAIATLIQTGRIRKSVSTTGGS